LPELEEMLRETAASHSPFHTKLRGMGGFPNERHVRALFVGVRKSRSLATLQATLSEALSARGFPIEDRDYHPHLTVGRLRKARNVVDLISPYVRTAFSNRDVSEIVLFESVMHGGHPMYVPLSRYALTGAPHEFEEEEELQGAHDGQPVVVTEGE
jgi:2'-5' RNA ligase